MKGRFCELRIPCIFTECKRLVGRSMSFIAAAFAAMGRLMLRLNPQEPFWTPCLQASSFCKDLVPSLQDSGYERESSEQSVSGLKQSQVRLE